MNWTKNKPTTAGAYGVRGFNLGRPKVRQFEAIVAVRLYNDELVCNLHQSTSDEDFDSWYLVSDMMSELEWLRFEADSND